MSDSVKKYHELVEEGTIIPTDSNKKRPYIFESPDGGKTVFKRVFGNINDRVLVSKDDLIDYSELDIAEAFINIARKFPKASPSLVLHLVKDELSVKKVCN